MPDAPTKTLAERIADLASHARLLRDACQRFSADHNFDEVRIIAVQLRVLVGRGRGNGILFELMEEYGETYDVLVLNQRGTIQVTEIEPDSERVVQEVERTTLLTQLFGQLPIVIPTTSEGLYVVKSLRDWIENGFLLDWEVPRAGATPEMRRFTPQFLINTYAGQEGAHADSTHGRFGQPVETVTLNYTVGDRQIVVPLVFDFLRQIGNTVSSAALKLSEDHQTPSN